MKDLKNIEVKTNKVNNKVNNQVSFHTEKALQYVKLVRRVSYARKDI